MDPFVVLGVARGASDADVRRAYRQRARETHPDKNPNDPDAARRFRDVAVAYESLSDPVLRDQYQQQQPYQQQYAPSSSSAADPFAGFTDPFELFRKNFSHSFGREFDPDYEDDFFTGFRGRDRFHNDGDNDGARREPFASRPDAFARFAGGGAPFGAPFGVNDPFGGFFQPGFGGGGGSPAMGRRGGDAPSGESTSVTISWRDGKKVTTRRRFVDDGNGNRVTHVTEVVEDEAGRLK